MNFPTRIYDIFMYPFEKLRLNRMRRNLLKHVKGEVLEIGTGTGVNINMLACESMTSYVGLDLKIKPEVLQKIQKRGCPFKLVEGSAVDLPFEDQQFDTVVFTLVFCSVSEPMKGLKEVYRVLKPGGRLIFIEHVMPNQPFLQNVFKRISPYWEKFADNCHLDRHTQLDIEKVGFRICRREFSFHQVFVGGIAKKGK